MTPARIPIVAAALAAALAAQDPGARRPGAALEELRAANDPELSIEVRIVDETAEIRFGEPFVVEVIRAWPVGLDPEPFTTDELAPLLVEPLGAERTIAGDRVRETLRWRAFAFRRGAVTLRPTLRVSTGDPDADRATTADPLTRFLTSSLADDDDGAVEVPAPRLATPFGWRGAIWRSLPIAALAGIGVLAIGFVARRRRAAHAAANADRSDPAAAWAALPRMPPDAPGAARDDARAIQAVLRAWLGCRGIDVAASRTEDELVAACSGLPGDARRRVAAIAGWCEAVKFAGADASTRRAAALEQLGELVATTPEAVR